MEDRIDNLEYLGHELSDLVINIRELQEQNGHRPETVDTLIKIEKLLLRGLFLHDNLLENKDFITG